MGKIEENIASVVNKDAIEEARKFSATRPDPQLSELWISKYPKRDREEILECIRYIHKFQNYRKQILGAMEGLSPEMDSDKIYNLTMARLNAEAMIVSLQDSVLTAKLLPPYGDAKPVR